MTSKEYILKLEQAIKEFSDGQWYRDLVIDMRASQAKRIFTLGKGGDGKIGDYSTKPMLATKSQFFKTSAFKQSTAASGISFSSNIKTRKTKARREKALDKKLWITFKNRKTGKANSKGVPVMILDNGYKEFRQIQGRESNFVNLNYTGDLFRDFVSTLVKIESGYITGVKRKINSDKIGWMIDKYGKDTFELHPYAKKKYRNTIRAKGVEIFSKFNNVKLVESLNTPEPND